MCKNCIKQLAALSLGIFLTTGTAQTFGQTLDDNPTGKNLSLDDKTLYEHGYNSNSAEAISEREGVDTVMVTSVMNYFVMPDKNYNKAYYAQDSYAATDLTNSKFVWTVENGSSFEYQKANSTETSPWIKVTWGEKGEATITVKEEPQVVGESCGDGNETEIPVTIIAQPTIGYNLDGFADSNCYNDNTVGEAFYDFPVAVTTESSQVWVTVSIKKIDFDGNDSGTFEETNVPVESGFFHLQFSDYDSGGYGKYEVTITEMTDRIARKCDVLGIINSEENFFTYSVMPMPKTGPIFHIPNDF
jgi:hypothetical protein